MAGVEKPFRVSTKRRLVITPDDPAVTQVIPTTTPLHHDTGKFLQVPYGVEEVKVLNNLGYKVEPPFNLLYNWGPVAPFEHQKAIASLMATQHRGYILADPGLGKTRGAIAAISWLREEGAIDPALVVAPLSILHATWDAEVFKWSNLCSVVLHGSKQQRLDLLNTPADVYIINYDGVKTILPALLKKDFGMLVLDESTAIKNAGTDRFKMLNRIAKKTPRIFALTGTPTPQGPMDAHGQIKMVTPCPDVIYKTRFKQTVMTQVSQFHWIPKATAQETIHKLMQPAVRFKSKDCLNLPPMTYHARQVSMSKDQSKAYKDMEQKMSAGIVHGTITAANAAVAMSKLIQISCGFLYDDNHIAHDLKPANRLSELEAVVNETPGKSIVFAGHTASVNLVHQFLSSKGYDVAKVDGSVSSNDRAIIFSDFQNAASPQILVAQERTASHGLTLTKADQVIWYSLPTSYEVFTQANFRIHRPSQKNAHYVVALIGTAMERKLLSRLKSRKSAQSLLLEMYGPTP